MDMRELHSAWEAAGIPVAVFPPAGREELYENSRCRSLTGGRLLAVLPSDEAQALCRAIDGHPAPPLFLHLGGEVFSTAVFPQGE